MIRLGITGGIGAGKSFVARMLAAEFGVPVYDCDREARRIMVEDASVRAAIIGLVGPDAYLPDGALNSPLVARYLFASARNAQAVNAIVHPAVKADVRRWFDRLEQQPSAPAVAAMESAILVEAGFTDVVQRLLVVEAPLRLRLKRICQRDHCTDAEARARVRAQLSDRQRRLRAASVPLLVVRNDGRDLRRQLLGMFATPLGQNIK